MINFLINKLDDEFDRLKDWLRILLENELRESEARIRADISELLERVQIDKDSNTQDNNHNRK